MREWFHPTVIYVMTNYLKEESHKTFVAAVSHKDQIIGSGSGKNKKEADSTSFETMRTQFAWMHSEECL